MKKRINRRTLLEKGVKGTLFLTPVWRNPLSIWAEIASQAHLESGILSQAERKSLRAAADEIIPSGEGMSSASDVGAVEYIEVVLKAAEELREQIRTALSWLQNSSRSRHQKDFADIASSQRTALLRSLEEGAPFATLRDLVYEAYYTNPRVWPGLGYHFYPTDEEGPSMKVCDESLLTKVRERGKYYRDVPDEKRKG